MLVFNPENPDLHPFSGALWKFVFLFYNPKLSRLLLFACGAWSSASPHVEDDTLSDDDEEMY